MAVQLSSASPRSSATFTSASFTRPSIGPSVGDVHGIIARAVSGARAQGRDYLGQCHAAVAAVIAVRPDLTAREAFDAVTRLRES